MITFSDPKTVSILLALAALIVTVLVNFASPQQNPPDNNGKDDFADSDAQDYSNLLDTSKDSDKLFGQSEKYDWNQDESEVEMFVKLDKLPESNSIKAKDVIIIIKADTIQVIVRGETIIDGEFYAPVDKDECTWQMDTAEQDKTSLVVLITLFKKTPTVRNQHWKSLLKGESTVNVSKLGPPIHGVDTGNVSSVRNAIEAIKKYR